MRIAILGCGNIANTHALALTQLGHSITVAVNPTPAKAKEFGSRWHAKRTGTEMTDVLADDVDCVHICTPPALHYEMVKQVLSAGKHVICEKPLCLDAEHAKELMELAKAKGLLAAVNFNVRYHEACKRAKNQIVSGDFGDIRLISGSYKQEFHVLPADYMWRYIPETGGKMRAVTEIGSHWIDLVRFWTGLEISAVSATLGRFNPDRYMKDGMMYPEKTEGATPIRVNSEDAAIITLRFSNGAIGSLLLSEVSHGHSNSITLEVSSGKKSIWWCSEDPYRLNSGEGKFCGVNSSVNAFGGGFPDTFSGFFEQVYSALESGSYKTVPDYPTFYDGYINAAVCEAIYNSSENNSEWTEVK